MELFDIMPVMLRMVLSHSHIVVCDAHMRNGLSEGLIPMSGEWQNLLVQIYKSILCIVNPHHHTNSIVIQEDRSIPFCHQLAILSTRQHSRSNTLRTSSRSMIMASSANNQTSSSQVNSKRCVIPSV